MDIRVALVAVLALPASALAGVTLSAERIAVGVNDDGSLCDTDSGVCLFYDPDGMGSGAPLGNDLLLPGRAFESWSATWTIGDQAQTVVASAPYNPADVPVVWSAPARSEDLHYVEGTLAVDGLDVHIAIDVPERQDVFWTTFTITATESVRGLELGRSFDFDPDVYTNGGYATINEAQGGVAVSSSRNNGGKALALGVVDGEAGLCTWCSTPADIRAGNEGIRDGDVQLGVAWGPVDLAAGETIRVRFAYALATDDDDAKDLVEAAIQVDDLDGDGQTIAQGDCDDRDADTASGAPEKADGRDNDCDDTIDEDTIISDDDGDGFSEVEGDCDDSLASVFPGAGPVADVIDADCDGLADSEVFDDGSRPDGWGDESVSAEGCSTSPTAPALVVLLLPLLIARRRR